MKLLRTIVATLLLALVAVAPALAQTTVTSTTIASALTADSTTLVVTSATGFSVGNVAFADREAFLIRGVSGTNITIQRGWGGTRAAAHAASTPIFVGSPEVFSQTAPAGACTATAEAYLPRIVIPPGDQYQCIGSRWAKIGADVGTVQASFVQGATVADALDTSIFIADRDYVVSAIRASWGTAESTGSMDIMVEKLTGTTACGSGLDLQASAIAGTGAANTVNTATLTTTTSRLWLTAGDRLCVDLSSTPDQVANMVVTVTLTPQ